MAATARPAQACRLPTVAAAAAACSTARRLAGDRDGAPPPLLLLGCAMLGLLAALLPWPLLEAPALPPLPPLPSAGV